MARESKAPGSGACQQLLARRAGAPARRRPERSRLRQNSTAHRLSSPRTPAPRRGGATAACWTSLVLRIASVELEAALHPDVLGRHDVIAAQRGRHDRLEHLLIAAREAPRGAADEQAERGVGELHRPVDQRAQRGHAPRCPLRSARPNPCRPTRPSARPPTPGSARIGARFVALHSSVQPPDRCSRAATADRSRPHAGPEFVPALFRSRARPRKEMCPTSLPPSRTTSAIHLTGNVTSVRRRASGLGREQTPFPPAGRMSAPRGHVKPPARELRKYCRALCRAQNSRRVSSRIVTGPAFTSETSIVAWNRPVTTGTPASRAASSTASSSGAARSAGAARV